MSAAKKFLVIVLCSAAAGTALLFQSHFWTEDFAREKAREHMVAYCVSSRLDPSGLTELTRKSIGRAVWAFEAIHDGGAKKKFIGVRISASGGSELYTGDPSDIGSAAYDAP